MAEGSDTVWVRQAQNGDKEAFGRLCRRYVKLCGSVAYTYMRDFHSAADVVQDSLLKAFQAMNSLDQAELFRPWLLGIVRRSAIDALRRRESKHEASLSTPEGPLDFPSSEPSPDSQLLQQDTQLELRNALASLPDKQREIVCLKYIEDKSYKEIAELLDMTESAVESSLFRARQALVQKMTTDKHGTL